MVAGEVELLEEICREISKVGGLSPQHRERLGGALGSRFKKAVKAIEEGAVKKYVFHPSGRVVWIVVGREKDYQVIPAADYCSCDDYYFHVISDDAPLCYHVIAQKLASATGLHETITESDDFYETLMREWRFIKREHVEGL